MKLCSKIFIVNYTLSVLGIIATIGIVFYMLSPLSQWAFFEGLSTYSFCVGGMIGASIVTLFVNIVIERLCCNIPSAIAALIASVVSIGLVTWGYLSAFILSPPDGGLNLGVFFIPPVQLGIYFVLLAILWAILWLIEKLASRIKDLSDMN